MKIHTNDNVLVTSGKDRGKTGKVLRVFPSKNKIIVEKTNIRTKHIKKSQNRPGERIQFEAPLAVANVMIICPACNKVTRVGMTVLENGKKQRTCKKCKRPLSTNAPVSAKAKKAPIAAKPASSKQK